MNETLRKKDKDGFFKVVHEHDNPALGLDAICLQVCYISVITQYISMKTFKAIIPF